MAKCVVLDYTIHKYSSYSANYGPQNIQVNAQTDQNSRWFTDSNTPSQFLLLKLRSPAIVHTITFGKYIKQHVANLKMFRIYGGTDQNNLSLLLSSGLKNNSQYETFQLRHSTVEGLEFPVLYLKIEPLQSWGPAYNYTIWYVQLQGVNDEQIIKNATRIINLRKEEEAVRIVLKQFRRRRYKEAFEALSRETGVSLEGPTQAKLWNALVDEGDYELAEQIVEKAVEEGELDWYVSWQPYTPTWTRISPEEEAGAGGCCHAGESARENGDATPPQMNETADICSDRDWMNGDSSNSADDTDKCESFPAELSCESCRCTPRPRGGHQLVVDSSTRMLYLFGGWDGTVDLDDLWCYDIGAGHWRVLCARSGDAGGPGPRSCHKMALDPLRQRIYTLGRYLDQPNRVGDNLKSEVHMYDIVSGEWSLLCEDTAQVGGPSLVFDHQMCIDVDTQTIYVFGGRVLLPVTEKRVEYSGLYAYYIATNTWQKLTPKSDVSPRPRVGHSMLFHPNERRLYIFAGQHNRSHLPDLWWWEVESGECGALAGGCPASQGPLARPGFTQRATLDPNTDEIFVLSGLKNKEDKQVCNALWVLSLRRGTWACLYRNESVAADRPHPRFAHQLVYDATEKVHYLFGGNPGLSSAPRARLGDLWRLVVSRPPARAVLRTLRARVREARYAELVTPAAHDADLGPSVRALHYLRDRLHDTVDHDDPEQSENFRRLPTALFAGVPPPECLAASLSPARARRLAGHKARARSSAGALDLSRALDAVLAATPAPPDPDLTEPYDDCEEPEPGPEDERELSDEDDDSEVRVARIQLYDELARYFRPSRVPPQADVYDLVKL